MSGEVGKFSKINKQLFGTREQKNPIFLKFWSRAMMLENVCVTPNIFGMEQHQEQ